MVHDDPRMEIINCCSDSHRRKLFCENRLCTVVKGSFRRSIVGHDQVVAIFPVQWFKGTNVVELGR